MKNDEVATLLYTIADLLDIKGEGFFKTRAYRIAAQTIMDLSEDITTVVEENRLKDIPGIGPALTKKITEYVTTGKLSYLETLQSEIPFSVLDLLNIPTLGPKKASVLFNQLNISTIEQLKKACNQGKLRNLDGFGELTEINIIRGIALIEKTKGRTTLHHATEISNKLLSHLNKSENIQQISIAGSLRRLKETIGDIDILVSSSEPTAVMDRFVQYPLIKQILVQGKTKTSILLSNNIQADLRVVEEKSYGAALQYFTGSKEHNVSLRSLALKQGYKLNEYGLFNKKDNTYLVGKDEKEIYHQLNLPYIPPEIRENRGEIDEGINDNLPSLLELKDIQGDIHIHSSYSDGHDTISTMAQAAETLGYSYIGITDHSESLHVAKGLKKDQIEKKAEEIKQINKSSKIKVFLGTECDIKSDGTLDYSDEVLRLFDYVGIGIHMKFNMSEKEATERIIQGMSHPAVTFLAHPTCRLIGHREPLPLDMEKIFETAVDTNTALEINSFPDRLDLNDVYVKRAKELGVRFCIGTDAHTKDHLVFMKYGVATARRGWLEKEQVLNTLSLEQITTLFNNIW